MRLNGPAREPVSESSVRFLSASCSPETDETFRRAGGPPATLCPRRYVALFLGGDPRTGAVSQRRRHHSDLVSGKVVV